MLVVVTTRESYRKGSKKEKSRKFASKVPQKYKFFASPPKPAEVCWIHETAPLIIEWAILLWSCSLHWEFGRALQSQHLRITKRGPKKENLWKLTGGIKNLLFCTSLKGWCGWAGTGVEWRGGGVEERRIRGKLMCAILSTLLSLLGVVTVQQKDPK